MNRTVYILFALLAGTAAARPAQHDPLPDTGWNTAEELAYAPPREASVDSVYMYSTIDSIAGAAIGMHAFPGCRVFVVRAGKVIMDRSYGWHDYSETAPVTGGDMYDLASITKVAASALALMKLTEDGIIELDEPVSKYYRPFRGTDKRKLTFREMLAHQSGLPSGVPMLRIMKKDQGKKWQKSAYMEDCFSDSCSEQYPVEVYRGIYLNRKYCGMLFDQIRDAKLLSKKYRYSDLPFVIFPPVVENVTGQKFEEYLGENFYKPMGLSMTFNPVRTVPLETIAPTENDEYFRHATIHGYVHDETAAMCGGVSGNAGLFSNARDLAVLMQMLLCGGTYGGRRYLNPETIAEFTRVQYPDNDNRRALGFDKPFFGNDTLETKDAYPAPAVSPSSFGHSGFTGTFVWADPEQELIYVFLCNRVNPSRDNKAFSESQARYTIQQAIYDAIRRFGEPATGGIGKAGPSAADGIPLHE